MDEIVLVLVVVVFLDLDCWLLCGCIDWGVVGVVD